MQRDFSQGADIPPPSKASPDSARGPQRGPRDPESSRRAGRPGGSRCAFETARGSHFEQGLETKRGAGGLANVASHGDEGPSFAASRTRLAAVTSVSAGSGPGRRAPLPVRPGRQAAPAGARRRRLLVLPWRCPRGPAVGSARSEKRNLHTCLINPS